MSTSLTKSIDGTSDITLIQGDITDIQDTAHFESDIFNGTADIITTGDVTSEISRMKKIEIVPGLGTEALPAIGSSFTSGTGVNFSHTNEITLSTTGIKRLEITDQGYSIQDGTAALPSLFVNNDTDTGLFKTTNGIGISAAGVERVDITDTEVNMSVPLTLTSSLPELLTLSSHGHLGCGTASGAAVLDTGVLINQGNFGALMLLLASRNTGSGVLTDVALYRVQFFFNGDNAPTTVFMHGDADFVAFGLSNSSPDETLNVSGQAGNASFTWIRTGSV